MPGIPLPKRVLRPFNYYENVRLDDDMQYKLVAGHDKKEVLLVFMLLPILYAIWALIIWLADTETEYLIKSLVALSISALMYIAGKKLKPKKFTIFNREKGTVSIPHVFLPWPRVHAPWEDFAGRIILTSSSVGAPRHELWLMHIATQKFVFLDASILDVYGVLGYWSFLVQYMDKTQPLPNVADLKRYGETTDGLGTWKDWETLESSQGFADPYYEWQSEVKQNPELDEVNHFIELRVLGKA